MVELPVLVKLLWMPLEQMWTLEEHQLEQQSFII